MPNENDYERQLREQRFEEQLSKEAAERKKKGKLKKPEEVKFPTGMFVFAVIADLIDYAMLVIDVSTGGLWLAIEMTVLNVMDILTGIVLLLWTKLKKTKSDPLIGYLVGMLIELIPFGDIVPTWTILVLAYYFKEKALTKAPLAKALKKGAKKEALKKAA